MTNEIDWDNAPEDAEFYAAGDFRKDGYFWSKDGCWKHGMRKTLAKEECQDYQERPQSKPKYEYGVEYPTNGQKPDLPDDVLVQNRLKFNGELTGSRNISEVYYWHNVSAFRIVDERYKPVETAQDELKEPDLVNHPKHYAIAPGVEAIDIIKASLTPEQFEGYLLGNFLKYRLRVGDKDDLRQDIEKSNWYRERLNQR